MRSRHPYATTRHGESSRKEKRMNRSGNVCAANSTLFSRILSPESALRLPRRATSLGGHILGVSKSLILPSTRYATEKKVKYNVHHPRPQPTRTANKEVREPTTRPVTTTRGWTRSLAKRRGNKVFEDGSTNNVKLPYGVPTQNKTCLVEVVSRWFAHFSFFYTRKQD